MAHRRNVFLISWLAAATILVGVSTPTVATTRSASSQSQATFTLDGVQLTVQSGALPLLSAFDAAPAGSAQQSASATSHDPYREITVTAIPFGTGDPDDPTIGIAKAGSAAQARAALAAYRASQQAQVIGHPNASLFGKNVAGSAVVEDVATDGPQATPTVVIEWAVDSGVRLWLVRASNTVTATSADAERIFSGLSLSAANTNAASTVVAADSTSSQNQNQSQNNAMVETPDVTVVGSQLIPNPSWWNGDCDTANYSAGAQRETGTPISSYPLSSNSDWEGLEACGPRPFYGEGPDVSVRFPGSRWGVLEFECVELSMRWMNLAWGVNPYPANGSGVVWNYSTTKSQYNPSGPNLTAIANNGAGPMPVPGDVLSFGATSDTGHTAVVTGITLDNTGTGTVNVIEENGSSNGWDSVHVSDWVLAGYSGGVSGWLHNPGYTLSAPQNIAGNVAGTSGDANADLVAVSGAGAWVMASNGTSIAPPAEWTVSPFHGTRLTTTADVTNPGDKQDLVAVNDDSSWVMTPSGSTFSAPTMWSSTPFYGTRATLLADVNGDGRADLVAINDNNVWVMLSNGTSFGPPTLWSSTPFYGTLTTVSTDLNADGKADLLAVNNTSTWVMTSTGSGFSAPALWSNGGFYGNRATVSVDVNGDGNADLVAINNTSTWVMTSTGSSFSAPTLWSNGGFYGTRTTIAADMNGDGKADLVAVNDSSTWVMTSTGSGFASPAMWSSNSI